MLLFVVTLVILVTLSPVLSLVMLVSVPLLVWSSLRYGKRSRPAFLALRDRVAETMSELQEGLTGVRVLQSYRRETDRYASYRVRSRAQVAAWRRISLVNIGFFPMIAFAQSLALAAVLVVGGYLERNGHVSVGTIVAFALYLISLFDPIARLGDWYTEFQSGRAALAKIAALLAEPTTVSGGTETLPATGALAADGVTFAYDGKAPAVAGISLAVAEGEHLALVGATGAGKSTLAKLFVRFYDPDEGGVSFAGVDLRDATLDALRRRIVFVPQEGHLFSGTIADNVRLAAPDATTTRCAPRSRDRRARSLRAPARRLGDRCPLTRREAVGGRATARLDCPCRARAAGRDRARRGHVGPRPAHGGGGRAGVGGGGTRPHDGDDRPSPLDRRACRPRGAARRGRLAEVASHDELVAQGERYARLWASWQAGLGTATAGT